MNDPFKIMLYPVSTEKAVKQMELDNVLTFIVYKKANKKQIKWSIEKAFSVKVDKIRTVITHAGKKKAYIKLKPETPAIDVTTSLGLA